MVVDFIDSESCEIDGKSLIYFRQPQLLLKSIESTCLRPYSLRHIEARLEDTKFSYSKTIPTFMEKAERDNKTFLNFKSDFIKEMRLKLRQIRQKRFLSK